MRLDAVSLQVALEPGDIPTSPPPGVWRRRLLDGLDRIEESAKELRSLGVDTLDDVARLGHETIWDGLQARLSLHAPGVIWSMGTEWYDTLLACIRLDRERLQSADTLWTPETLLQPA